MDALKLKSSRHALFNLTRPEKSYFLKAPLAKTAGGFAHYNNTRASRSGQSFTRAVRNILLVIAFLFFRIREPRVILQRLI